jgi:hypothetical protein
MKVGTPLSFDGSTMTDEQIAHVRNLLDVTQRRHDELELQAARFGPSHVPAVIAIELQESKESIERLNAKLRIVTVPLDVQAATGPESAIDVLRLSVHDMRDQVGTMWRYLEHMILEDRASSEDWRKLQTSERRRGVWERRIIEAVLAIGIGVAVYLALNY